MQTAKFGINLAVTTTKFSINLVVLVSIYNRKQALKTTLKDIFSPQICGANENFSPQNSPLPLNESIHNLPHIHPRNAFFPFRGRL